MNSPQKAANFGFLNQWIILITVLLTIGGYIAYSQIMEYQYIDAQERLRLSAQAETVEKNVVPQLVLTYQLIDGIINELPNLQAKNGNYASANHLLKLLDDATDGISPIMVINVDGNVVASSEKKLIGMNFAQREYFKTALNNPDPNILHISAPFKTVLDTYVISLFRTIPGPDGEFGGIVIASAVPGFFATILNSVCYTTDMWAGIVHGDGKLYMLSPDRPKVTGKDLMKPGSFFMRHLESGKVSNVYSGSVFATGENRMVALRTIQPSTPQTDKPLVVLVARDLDSLFAPWRKNTRNQVLLFFALTTICSLGLLAIQRRQRDQIYERNLAEDTLRANEAHYRSLFESSIVGVTVVGKDSTFLEANDAFCNMLGYTKEELVNSRTFAHISHPDDVNKSIEMVNKIVSHEFDHYSIEKRYISKNGETIYSLIYVRGNYGHNGEYEGLTTTIIDITERKFAEEAIKTSEDKFSKAFSACPAIITIASMDDGRYIDVNDIFFTTTGYQKDEVIGRNSSELGFWLDTNDRQQYLDDLNKYGSLRNYEISYRMRNNEVRDFLVSSEIIEIAGKRSSLNFILDITERKQVYGQLQASERRFKELIKNSSDSVTILDKDGVQIYVSDVVEKMLGYTQSELINIPVMKEMIHPDDQESVLAAFMTIVNEGEGVAQYRHKHKNGSWVFLEAWGTNQLENPDIRGIVVNVRDITERKRAEQERVRLEQQLLHAQKLESLGVLAGGIAHDFNNILTSIIGNAELALLRMKPESPGISNIHKIEQAATQAADLAKQMLAYSGKGKFVVEYLDINCLLEEMLHLLDVSISKMAELRLNFAPSLPTVEADAAQIRQIVMNLVINASEAIGDNSGVITITTGCMDCDKSYLKNFWLDESIKEGAYVYIDIADTGCGMSRGTLDRIFDPFFTTKFTGRGLGMAAVQGIVKGHRGAIKVDSELGKGTSFKILLPASGTLTENINRDSHTIDWKGEGKVLLVDDEETIRDVAKEMLREFGFTTITANDGRDAIEIFKKHPDIAFVILDLTMPYMDGEQCYRELKQINPDVKVVISSGFSEHEVTQKFAGLGLAGFIQKPYKLSELKEAIRKI